MKAHELATILLAGPNGEVIMQKDAEGNGYSPMAGAEEAIYIPNNGYDGEVISLGWSAGDCDMEEDEWEEMRAQPKCVVLYPIN